MKIQEKKANAMMKDIRRQLELERKRSERLQNALSSEGGVPVGLSSASAMSPGTPEPLKKSRSKWFHWCKVAMPGSSSNTFFSCCIICIACGKVCVVELCDKSALTAVAACFPVCSVCPTSKSSQVWRFLIAPGL